MNILFLFHSPIIPHIGGVQRVTSIVGEGLSKRGHQIYYLSYYQTQKNAVEEISAKQLVIDSRHPENNYDKDYLNILKQNKIDVVISQKADDISLHLLSITPISIKRLSVYHIQPFPFLNIEKEFKRSLKAKTIKHNLSKLFVLCFPLLYRKHIIHKCNKQLHKISEVSEKIVFLSDRFCKKVLTYSNIPKEKLVAINNPNSFADNEVNVTAKNNLIIFVGRLENTQKNIFGFVKMWEYFAKWNREWTALIIGEGDARSDIEKYINDHKVERIYLLGQQNRVEEYYKSAKFICLTSHFEGWGMVLTEGMTFGCVPVCFDSYESCHDIINDGIDGIIAPPFDTVKMATRIAEIGNDENKYREMSLKASQKAKSFNKDAIVDQWEVLLQG